MKTAGATSSVLEDAPVDRLVRHAGASVPPPVSSASPAKSRSGRRRLSHPPPDAARRRATAGRRSASPPSRIGRLLAVDADLLGQRVPFAPRARRAPASDPCRRSPRPPPGPSSPSTCRSPGSRGRSSPARRPAFSAVEIILGASARGSGNPGSRSGRRGRGRAARAAA